MMMEWYHWKTLHSIARKHQGYRGNPTSFLAMNQRGHPDAQYVSRLIAEEQWTEDRRPYYHLYPGVIDAFLNTRLDLPRRLLTPPKDGMKLLPTMTVCLPKGNGFLKSTKNIELSSIMFSFMEKHLWLWWDYKNSFTYQFGVFNLNSEDAIETALQGEVIQGIGAEPNWKNTHYNEVLRLVVATILLPLDDQDLVRPEVLARDRKKWEQTHDLKLIDRAKRNRRYGFVIGEAMEEDIATQRKLSPHYRRPHLVLQPYGPHQSLRRLQCRQG